jgi:hypothetical protein
MIFLFLQNKLHYLLLGTCNPLFANSIHFSAQSDFFNRKLSFYFLSPHFSSGKGLGCVLIGNGLICLLGLVRLSADIGRSAEVKLSVMTFAYYSVLVLYFMFQTQSKALYATGASVRTGTGILGRATARI